MSGQQPVFDLGVIADVPARSDWDLEFTLYLPTARNIGATYSAELAAEDVVRFRLFSEDGGDAVILVTDAAASAGGTTLVIDTRGVADTTPAVAVVKLSSTDTDRTVGSYQFLVDVQDASDSDRWHPACRGVIRITAAPAAVA